VRFRRSTTADSKPRVIDITVSTKIFKAYNVVVVAPPDKMHANHRVDTVDINYHALRQQTDMKKMSNVCVCVCAHLPCTTCHSFPVHPASALWRKVSSVAATSQEASQVGSVHVKFTVGRRVFSIFENRLFVWVLKSSRLRVTTRDK
jgi:hypothetical protein